MSRTKMLNEALRRVSVTALAAVGVGLLTVCGALGESYPSKPIKVILPLGADSPINVMARIAAPALSTRIGQPVIVENRPGGGGTIGTREVVRAAPDGYTLLFVGVNHVLAPVLFKAVDYNPVTDFSPIATVATGAWILVVAPSVPARSMRELIDYAKTNPGKLNWGFGQATGPHLFGEMLLAETGMNVAKISYKAGPQAIPDMLGGRIQINIGAIPALLPLIQEGKVRALAISSETRSHDLPDVPTMSELGFPRLTRGAWSGILAPAHTSQEIVTRLSSEMNAGLVTPELKASLAQLGFEPKVTTPQGFADFLRDEIDAWSVAARSAGIQPK